MGLVLAHKLRQIVWRGFTKPFKRSQETSYKYDTENNKHVTREEQLLVRDTWRNDQLAHREIKNSRNKECLVAGTALEVNALQAYVARTVMRKSGQATASVSLTEFNMQTYQELHLDTFDEETQEDLDSEKSSDDDDDDNEEDDDGDDKMGGKDENNKEDADGDKRMKEKTSTPPPSPSKAPPSPMHTDQAEDAQQPPNKSAPASPMHTDSAEDTQTASDKNLPTQDNTPDKGPATIRD